MIGGEKTDSFRIGNYIFLTLILDFYKVLQKLEKGKPD
jgi:hypothetical protein